MALGLNFDLDPAKAGAKAQQARALQTQVEGLERFARTGIPMEVRKAHDEAVQSKRIAAVAEQGSTAARKWMIFAGAAFATGTGEAKDLLEGLAAYLAGQARPLRGPAEHAGRPGPAPLRHRRDRRKP